MTRLTDLARGIHGHPEIAEREDEAEHYDVCPVCEEAFDKRNLAEVFYHAESAYHEPIHTRH